MGPAPTGEGSLPALRIVAGWSREVCHWSMGGGSRRHRGAALPEERRLYAVTLRGEGIPQAEVARRVTPSPQALDQWVLNC